MRTKEQNIQELWDNLKIGNICITQIYQKRENRVEEILEVRKAEYIPNLMRYQRSKSRTQTRQDITQKVYT